MLLASGGKAHWLTERLTNLHTSSLHNLFFCTLNSLDQWLNFNMHISFNNTINANMIAFTSTLGLYLSLPSHDGKVFRSQSVCCMLNSKDRFSRIYHDELKKRNCSIKSRMSVELCRLCHTRERVISITLHRPLLHTINDKRQKKIWRSHLRIVVYPWILLSLFALNGILRSRWHFFSIISIISKS